MTFVDTAAELMSVHVLEQSIATFLIVSIWLSPTSAPVAFVYQRSPHELSEASEEPRDRMMPQLSISEDIGIGRREQYGSGREVVYVYMGHPIL